MKKVCLLIFALLLTGCVRKDIAAEPTMPPTEAPRVTVMETTIPETEPTLPPQPESEDTFVRVLDYIPTATQELRYATADNFTGQVIYPFTDAYLRWGTVQKLILVSEDLAEFGLYIKIWDGFRPVSAQFTLWEVCPNPTYVANPTKGYSSHSRGNTIDLTLVDGDGRDVEMPTAFDDFSAKADRNYEDCTETAANHAELLEILMEKHGFTPYFGEWWHFSDTTGYPVEHVFEP